MLCYRKSKKGGIDMDFGKFIFAVIYRYICLCGIVTGIIGLCSAEWNEMLSRTRKAWIILGVISLIAITGYLIIHMLH